MTISSSGGLSLASAGISGSGVSTSLVQAVTGTTTGTSLTLTFSNAVTSGDSVIIAVCGFFGGSISGITIGGTGGTFSEYAGSTNNAQIWVNPNCGVSSATIVITTSTAGILAWAYEFSGVATRDVTSTGSGTSTSWSSGAASGAIPYSHITVGIGTIVSNTGSITGPSGAWVNEAAHTDVVGAGSHAIGGVSGYQVSTPATTSFTYSGTSGTSSAWGGAVVSLAIVAQPSSNYGAVIQGGWGGYVFNEHEQYTGVTATFTLPSSLSGVSRSSALISVWVALGNVNQVGMYMAYDNTYTNGVYTSGFSWWIPGMGEIWDETAYPVGASDSVTLSVSLTSTYWYFSVVNNTRAWSYTDVMSVGTTNLNSWNYSGTSPFGATTTAWVFPISQAAVIVEKESGEATQYGSITFTNISTTPAVTQAPYPVITVGASDIIQYPGSYSISGEEFTMTWNNYS